MLVPLSKGARWLARTSLVRPLAMLQSVKHQPVASTGVQTQTVLQHQLPKSYECRRYFSTVQDLPATVTTYEEVVEALKDSSAIVIDVRQPEELERDGAIPGALHIPLGDLEVWSVFS